MIESLKLAYIAAAVNKTYFCKEGLQPIVQFHYTVSFIDANITVFTKTLKCSVIIYYQYYRMIAIMV